MLADRIQRPYAAGKLDSKAVLRAAKAGLLPREAAGKRLDNLENAEAALRQAIDDNKAFLALSAPTAAQRNNQIEKLTRQMQRAIRLLLSELYDAD